jgi:hypothetical protein
VFLASLLRDAAARLRIWCSRSSVVATVAAKSDATPTPYSNPPRVTVRIIDRTEVGKEVAEGPPKRRRPIQPRPTLWEVKSSNTGQRLYCGPVAVAALIGANVDEVIRVIQQHRNNRRQVRFTHYYELQHALRHFGRDLQLVADLSRKSPTLATWERERTYWEFEQAWLLTVTGHWVAVRGRWFVDTWTNGTPVRIGDAPRRRKRVRYAYRVC